MRYGVCGVVGVIIKIYQTNRNILESMTEEGESPVRVRLINRDYHLSRAGHVESCLNLRRPCRKAKYDQKTDSEPVP